MNDEEYERVIGPGIPEYDEDDIADLARMGFYSFVEIVKLTG